ncbi:MAG TPA: alanine--glyoxylate aminotransferase family protein [Candidatus Binataceae bacterium]
MESFPKLKTPERILLGAGPTNVNPRVLQALAQGVIGHLDPEFLRLMEALKSLLREAFRTANPITFPVSGTGSAAQEACMVNLIEEGDEVVIGVNGLFGTRLAEMADRLGAKTHKVEAEWGRIIEVEQVEAALRRCRKPKLIAMVHAETSTGVHQPHVAELAELAHRYGALIVLDVVTSLGCVPVEIDQWQIDAAYSCTQKGLGAPPGLGPLTIGERGLAAIRSRKSKCRSWYLDIGLIEQYWGHERLYHHTAPINLNYALYEALRVVIEEGLEKRWERHRTSAAALQAGLSALGLELAAQENFRLPQLTAIRVPEGIDEAKVRSELLRRFNTEIGAGLGPLRGRVWRIGLMGDNANPKRVLGVLDALEEILREAGLEIPRGSPRKAAASLIG